MAKVIGVGGVFFKCADREKTAAFYSTALGFEIDADSNSAMFRHADVAAALGDSAHTVWSAFKSDTDYFQPSSSDFMINLIVDDLDGALDAVRAAGGKVVDSVQSYDFGRFGYFIDPDGRKVELWQPTPSGAG